MSIISPGVLFFCSCVQECRTHLLQLLLGHIDLLGTPNGDPVG